MNILLCNGGFVNKGAEAMLRTVQYELGRRLGPVRFWHENSGHPIALDDPRLLETDNHKRFCERTRAGRLWNRVLGVPSVVTDPLLPFLDEEAALTVRRVPGLDAIIDISGFAYTDAWGRRLMRKAVAFARYARRRGIPLVYMPQAWGPFGSQWHRDTIRQLYNHAALLYSRDEVSSAHLASAVGINAGDVLQVPDIAFAFAGESPSAVGPILQGAGLAEPTGRPLVGIAPNMRVFERAPRTANGSSTYLHALSRIITHAIESWSSDVVLVPHETRHQGSRVNDDRELCRRLLEASQYRTTGRLAAIVDDLPAEVLKGVVGRTELMIGSRYHALIAAMSQGTSAVAMGWSHKYDELMGLAGLKSVGIDYMADSASATAVLDEAWRSREAVRRHLDRVVPGIREQVAAAFDKVAVTISLR